MSRRVQDVLVVAAAVAVVVLMVFLFAGPMVKTCYYWHPELLESGRTPMPVPSMDQNGLVCE